MIGENSSIRDSQHSIERTRKMINQKNLYKPISIGNDVWIGAGCYILSGSTLPEGVIIGANSVVTHKSEMQQFTVYAGSPVKKIKLRKTDLVL